MSLGADIEYETATFGAGCFWCLDAAARRIGGVKSSVVGYAGGSESPTYYEVHGGSTGHVEAVQIVFDPSAVGFDSLLSLFFAMHDPTTPNQDGANHGPEYHSTIFYHDNSQYVAAIAAIECLSIDLGKAVVTTVVPYTGFFEGEQIHQDFYNKNQNHPYCTFIIEPKLRRVLFGTQ